jgi:stalled ribosome rescue protein Dom34
VMGAVDVLLVGDGLDDETRQRLAGMAESTDAHVEYVPAPSPVLSGLGGVGALLRFRIQGKS